MRAVFIFFLFIIFYVFYIFLGYMLFGEDDLVKRSGRISNKSTFTKTVINNKDTAVYAYLTIKYREDPRNYVLKLDVSKVFQGFNALTGVNEKIDNSNEVYTWVKKGELERNSPKILRIEADGEIIFDANLKPVDKVIIFQILSALALLFFTLFYTLNHFNIR